MDPDMRSLQSVALLSLGIACGVFASNAHAEAPVREITELHGVVLDVTDGDTIVLGGADGTRTRVRLAEIDAPEMSQPYGVESKRAWEELLKHERVRRIHLRLTGNGRNTRGCAGRFSRSTLNNRTASGTIIKRAISNR